MDQTARRSGSRRVGRLVVEDGLAVGGRPVRGEPHLLLGDLAAIEARTGRLHVDRAEQAVGAVAGAAVAAECRPEVGDEERALPVGEEAVAGGARPPATRLPPFWPTTEASSPMPPTSSIPCAWKPAMRLITWLFTTGSVKPAGELVLLAAGASRFSKWIWRQSPAAARRTSGRGRLSGRRATLPGSAMPPEVSGLPGVQPMAPVTGSGRQESSTTSRRSA